MNNSAETGRSREQWASPIVTVDVVLFSLDPSGELEVALLRRDTEPFVDALALPGGYVRADQDDDTQAAALRVIRTKLGLDPPYLEQLATFSGRYRDPRGWSLSVAYIGVVPWAQAAGLACAPVARLPDLPFDHGRIVRAAEERLRNKATYSSLIGFLLPPVFTMAEAHRMFCAVTGEDIALTNFRRKVLDEEVIVPAGNRQSGGTGRPAQLYRMAEPQLVATGRVLTQRH